MRSGWHTSSYSTYNGNCVECAHTGGQVAVRDSKAGPDAPVLEFSTGAWAEFINAMKDGQVG
jgi:hypothetical protein